MAFPVTLNGRTYTLTDFEGTNYVDGLPDAFEDFVTHAGDIYNSTSTTSNSIGTGSKTFTVEANKPYQAGTPLRIADAAAPSTNFLDTVVTSYSGTTLVVNSIGYGGSGTKTSWTVNIGGAKTVDGTLGLSQGGTGATTAAAARTNLDTYSKTEADSRFLNVSGEASDVTMNGNTTIGDASSDTLTVNATSTFNSQVEVSKAGNVIQTWERSNKTSNTGYGSLNIETNSQFTLAYDSVGGLIIGSSTDPTTQAGFQNDLRFIASEIVVNEDGRDKDFRVESDGNSNMLFVDAGENAVKIGGTTTREGALQIFTTAGGVAMEIESTNAGSGQGPILQLRRTSSSPAGNDYLGGLNFVGQDSGNNALSYVDMYTRATTITDGSEESQFSIRTRRNGVLEERVTIDAVETTFNNVGADIDFRVESDNNANMLFVDAGNDRVGIGQTNAPQGTLHVDMDINSGSNYGIIQNDGTANTNTIAGWVIRDGTTVMGGVRRRRDGAGSPIEVGNFASDAVVDLLQNNERRITLDTSSNTVVNEPGIDSDFRVESDSNSHAIFVDASNGLVNINTTDTSVANNTGSARGINLGFGYIESAAYQDTVLYLNRMNNDGTIVDLRQNGSTEGTISVSGSTVSYNGFAGRHESSGIPTTTARGTVVSTIDELDEYLSGTKQGQTRADHAKVKVSDSVGDARVYGVVDDFDENDKLFVVSVGIASVKVTGSCSGGDLLESNGDGTAKVQSDDIVRSKTIGKVTIGNSDTGVKLVSCVMYCG